ncbi:MAG: fibronectin type III domain-containing protein, partial [Candidatus Uhrbacteria bacterium]|nr:fibronectin type III domain-containing protein [Candidatus Uhrbacteria bacterium]
MSVVVGQPITIAMTGNDDHGVEWLLWSDGYSNGPQWQQCGGLGSLSCSKSWIFTPTAPGSYIFTGMVWDHFNHAIVITSNAITVAALPTCSAPTTFSSTGQSNNSITMAWSPVSGAKNYKLEWWKASDFWLGILLKKNSVTTPDYAVSYMAGGLNLGVWYGFDIAVVSDDNTVCKAPSKWYFNDISSTKIAPLVKTNGCLKTKTPIMDTNIVSVPLSGGGACTITIKHLGQDLSDSGAEQDNVSYEILSSASQSRTIGMDDNPDPGCQNDLEWNTAWSASTNKFIIGSAKQGYSATHLLKYGFEVSSSAGCAFNGIPTKLCTATNCGQAITVEKNNSHTYRISSSRGSNSAISTDGFEATFNLVPDNLPNITAVSDNQWH